VLDVGCGAGAALAPASRVASSAVGVELSPAMAERAREAAPAADVRVGDATRLDFEDGSFDVVLSAFTVFFMPDPTAAMQEWRRVLTPEGRFVLSTWSQGDPRWAFERDIRRAYVSEFEPAALEELGRGLALLERFSDEETVTNELRAAGFDDVETTEHQIEFVFADLQAWWDFNWSHGSRVFLEPLSEDTRNRYRAEAAEAMEQVREERGYPRTYTALFAKARSGL
jgi:ubiquinone/menaquinone biosynthesis C-methylase UbiE